MAWWKRLKKDNAEKLSEFREEAEKEGGIGKKDTFAMLLSAFLVFVPIAILVLAVFAAVILGLLYLT
ncbi:MAG: hypothetical protein IJW46_05435 [Clostridia bacterium]|nr:hypothetical protein [Clostridia bacterium]